jgi:hypothetical protein
MHDKAAKHPSGDFEVSKHIESGLLNSTSPNRTHRSADRCRYPGTVLRMNCFMDSLVLQRQILR